MTNHTIPALGAFRVCVFAAPGNVVGTDVASLQEAYNTRSFMTVANSISRAHTGSEYPADAFAQRYNGSDWCLVPIVVGDLPWRVVSIQGVFRFESAEAANFFAAHDETVEYSPDMKLARTG